MKVEMSAKVDENDYSYFAEEANNPAAVVSVEVSRRCYCSYRCLRVPYGKFCFEQTKELYGPDDD